MNTIANICARRRLLIFSSFFGALIFLLLLVYLPTFSFGFLRWDDNGNIYDNPYIHNDTWTYFWSHVYYGMYIPLSYSIWSFLYSLDNGDPLPFRILNFFLHLTNTFLVAVILRHWQKRLGIQSIWAWIFGTALFALHPLQVETIAWITGGRDLMATFFALMSIVFVLKLRVRLGHILGALFFSLGILCKPSIIMLPAVLLFIQCFEDPRKLKELTAYYALWCLGPFLIIYFTLKEQSSAFGVILPLWQRFFVMVDSFGFYLIKIIWPLELAVDYGRSPQFLFANWKDQWFPAVFFGLFIIFLAATKSGRSVRVFAIAWILSLLPVTGLVPFAFQEFSTVADRYNYFPFLFVAAGIMSAFSFKEQFKNYAAIAVAACFVLLWVTLGISRIPAWGSNEAFYKDMLRMNPQSFSAMMGLGSLASDKMNDREALEYYLSAERLRPGDLGATDSILMSQVRLKDFNAVISIEHQLITAEFEQFLSLRPRIASNILTNFGVAHYYLGDSVATFNYFCLASLINPSNSVYKKNAEIGVGLMQKSDPTAKCDRIVFQTLLRSNNAAKSR